MNRFALFTTECAQLGDTITQILERHGDDLAVVVTSDVYRTGKGGLLRQLRTNLARSGPGFVAYLLYGFVAYRGYLAMDRSLGRLPWRRRRRRSIAEQCAKRGIRHIVTADVNDPAVVRELRCAKLDLIVVYWFDQILRGEVIAAPRRAVVNVHAAHLPNCRGLFPVLHSALEPATPFGVSAHLIEDTRIDAGPVLAQRRVSLPTGRSVLYYDAVVNSAGVELLSRVLADLEGHLARALAGRSGTYYSYPTRGQVRAARAGGLALCSLRDFMQVCRGQVATAALPTRVPLDVGAGPVSGPNP